jgi:hypothetical protein
MLKSKRGVYVKKNRSEKKQSGGNKAVQCSVNCPDQLPERPCGLIQSTAMLRCEKLRNWWQRKPVYLSNTTTSIIHRPTSERECTVVNIGKRRT